MARRSIEAPLPSQLRALQTVREVAFAWAKSAQHRGGIAGCLCREGSRASSKYLPCVPSRWRSGASDTSLAAGDAWRIAATTADEWAAMLVRKPCARERSCRVGGLGGVILSRERASRCAHGGGHAELAGGQLRERDRPGAAPARPRVRSEGRSKFRAPRSPGRTNSARPVMMLAPTGPQHRQSLQIGGTKRRQRPRPERPCSSEVLGSGLLPPPGDPPIDLRVPRGGPARDLRHRQSQRSQECGISTLLQAGSLRSAAI